MPNSHVRKTSNDSLYIVNCHPNEYVLQFTPTWMLLPANLQVQHNVIFYRRCNTLYVHILRGNGHVSLSRSPRLHTQPSVQRDRARAGWSHANTGIFRTRKSACVPLHTHVKCCSEKLLQKSTVCVCVYAHRKILEAKHSRVFLPTALSSPKSRLHRQLSG